MISGRRTDLAWLLAALALTLALALANAPAAGADTPTATTEPVADVVRRIVAGIETPRDTPIPFVEQRTSRLLDEPLTLDGEIWFAGDGTLSKRIGAPFDEQITISARRIELRRDGKFRRLSINRRPDIKAFYAGMQALLAGDVTALYGVFDVAASADADRWQLDLTPRDDQLNRFVARLVISGSGSRVRIVRTEQPGGDWQEMSFGLAAD